MNLDKLNAAIHAAEKFNTKALVLKRLCKELPTSPFYGSKESSAVRRASMDLTRALADLRRPG